MVGKKKIEGKTAEEWFDLGYKEKDPKKEIEYYSKCLKLDPKNADAWNNKGVALEKLGRYEEAIRCFDKALEIINSEKDESVWFGKGFAFYNLGRYEEAIRCYDKALKIDPEDEVGWYIKGVALAELGRYEEAIRCFDKALEIDPEVEEVKNDKKLAEEKLKGYYRAKIEQWKSEGYNVSELEEMLK